MRPLRISAISFLNTAPLMWSFENEPTSQLAENFDINYTVPSACARALLEGTADIGIIPAITYATIPDLVIIPDIAIASRGPSAPSCWSARYLSSRFAPLPPTPHHAPPSFSLVCCCRTGTVARVKCAKWLPTSPRCWPLATQRCSSETLPFWPPQPATTSTISLNSGSKRPASRSSSPSGPSVAPPSRKYPPKSMFPKFSFTRATAAFVPGTSSISQKNGVRVSAYLELVHDYLADNIYYYLDSPCLEGLQLFYRLAAECSAIPHAPELHFL